MSALARSLTALVYGLMFILSKSGKDYGIGPWKKIVLVLKILRNHRKYHPLTSCHQHLLLAEDILQVPKEVKGDVVECGAYNGSTSVSLSLACALTGRRLFVCDSYKGFPESPENENYAVAYEGIEYQLFGEGDLRSEGGLEGVNQNIAASGNIEVCTFVDGYFRDTLPDLETDSIVMVFEDADLPSSVKDCLQFLWPKLQSGCRFYCHEPWSIDVVSVFYDREWWRETLATTPPGFYGSGLGIRIHGKYYRSIGYALKNGASKLIPDGKQLVTIDSRKVEDPSTD